MSEHEIANRNAEIDEAYGVNDHDRVPALKPAGPQMVMIDDKPQGALSVAVKRDVATIYVNIKKTAAAAGDEFFYRWPVKNKDGSTDWIEGPSVKLTNAIARIYGNCSLKVRALDQTTHWMIQAQFIDLETGYVLERPFQQRKGQNIGGKMDKDRALDIVFQIGVSKATRNVVSNALAEFVDYAFNEAKGAIVKRVSGDLEGYRNRVIARLGEHKVELSRVERQIGRPVKQWLAPDIARLIAEIQSINDGMADADEMWPHPQPDGPRPKIEDFENPDRQVNEDTPNAKPAAEPQTNGATDGPKADADEHAEFVGKAIAAAATADAEGLEMLDDNVSTRVDAAGREDLRRKWNDEGYLPRKNALRVAKNQPKETVQPKPEPQKQTAAPVSTVDELADFYRDKIRELAKTKDLPALDDLQDRVAAELVGNTQLTDQWKNACNARAREIMGSKRR